MPSACVTGVRKAQKPRLFHMLEACPYDLVKALSWINVDFHAPIFRLDSIICVRPFDVNQVL